MNGTLNVPALPKLERKLKYNQMFKRKVFICNEIDMFMKGALLAAEAEIEMNLKRIDLVAAGFVNDYFKQNIKKEPYRKYLSWS